jgi:hypothetical protein
VHFDTNKKTWTTEDGAFHTFYSLKAHELEAIKHELWQLKLEALESGITTHQLPLGVHPSLKSSKTQKYFHQKLVKILLKYAGDQKLTQMTFMSLLSPHRWWQFGGFQLINRQWKEIKIPRLKSTHMDLFNMDMTINPETGLQIGMNASISILPSTYPYQDNFQAIINKISRENIPQTIELYQSKMMAINRFENPLTTNPNNLDCASCHFTEATRYYILSKFPQLKTILEDAYANPDPKIHNMQNQSIETQSTKIVRAFGYFGSQAAFSQRVIHDSVETAHFFNR